MAVKSDDEFLFTAPVMIPDKPDCDYERGEKPFTAEEIEFFKNSFEDYQLIDKNHHIFFDIDSAKTIGDPKDSFLLENDTSLEFRDGTTEVYPAGTWMLTTNVTDPVAQREIDDGILTGYSLSVNRHDIGELIKRYMATKASRGQLIHDIEDPEAITVSIVRKPCQTGSKVCKNNFRSDTMSDDKKTLDKIRELLIPEKVEYATKSDLDALADELKKSQEAAIKSMDENIGTVIADSLKELGAVKSKKDEEEDEDGDQKPEQENDEGEDQEQEEDESDSEEEEKKKRKDGSKQKNIHNGATKGDTEEELDTYAFLGRRPDGTSKNI